MKGRKGMCIRLLLWSLVLLLAAPPGGVMAQDQGPGGQVIFRQEELDQMLAPIALYPDDLLVQVFMAATYPLEVVEAARWVGANQNLKGDQMAIALERQDWDPSVKSLVNFPSVLQMMNDRLEWTQMLGDAFLAQEDQVMDTVQRLRQRAQAKGYLRNTSQQRVIVDQESQGIIIEPSVPQVVYVPVYDPTVVYGPWWWPAYQPYYYHPRGMVIRGDFIGFGLGVALDIAWGYAWGAFNWHHHDVAINFTRNAHFNHHIDRNRYVSRVGTGGGQGTWRHDSIHRRGVTYRSPSVAQQYGRGPLPGVQTRRDFRGFDQGETARAAQRSGRPAVQQRQVTAGSIQPRPQAPGPSAALTQQKVRPAPVPQVKVEPPKQPVVGSIQQPRITPSPAAIKPEQSRQPVSLGGRAGVQGIQGPTAFGGGTGSGSQAQQFSNRGHKSLGSAPPVLAQPPGGKGKGPGGGRAPRGDGSDSAPRGGR